MEKRRIDSLRRGTLFLDSDGVKWMYVRPYGTPSNGVCYCERQTDGFRSTFAGCAEVTITSEPTIFFAEELPN